MKIVDVCVQSIVRNSFQQAVRLAATLCPRPVTLTFDLEVGVGVSCVLGYHCAKFRLPRPFGYRADVRDIRRTDGRRTPITA